MLRCLRRIAYTLIFSISSLFAQDLPTDRIAEWVNRDYSYLRDLYEHLHANPELSFQEENTSKRIADELTSLGFDVTQRIGGFGLVGVLKNGDGPTLLLRTDLDALPVLENTGLKYASKARTIDDQGDDVAVMHACGHDVHMTCFIGTARILAQMKNSWKGTLVMIGQPAEERGAGARAMLADGLFERFPRPDFALALHSNAALPAGTVGYCEGYALANVDMVDINIYGSGGHGAYPHTTKDPIVLSARIILALQTIVSREVMPIEPAVVTVGSIHGGTKHNIIPDEVKLQLTLRSYSDEVRNQTIEAIKRMTKGIAMSAGIPEELYPSVSFHDESIPSTYNDPDLTRKSVAAFRTILEESDIIKTSPVMGGEDFGLYGREEPKIPICMFWLGTVHPDKIADSRETGQALPSLHSALFAPETEPTIKTGVKALSVAALNLLTQ